MESWAPEGMMWTWRPSADDAVTHPYWGAFLQIGLSLILLSAVWWPIYAGVMRKVAHNIRLTLPERTWVRSFCLAAVGFGALR